MSMKKSRNQRGLSLLEILLAIVLLAMVIMATATVYPGGFKLNATNKYASQATALAQAIVEEIKLRPFKEVEVGTPDTFEYFSIEELAQNYHNGTIINMCAHYRWPFHNESFADDATWHNNCPVICWETRTSLDDMYRLLKAGPQDFFLAEKNNTLGVPAGIAVIGYGNGDLLYDPGEWTPDPVSHEPHIAKVQVTVSWVEMRNKLAVPKSVTISTWVTENKNE